MKALPGGAVEEAGFTNPTPQELGTHMAEVEIEAVYEMISGPIYKSSLLMYIQQEIPGITEQEVEDTLHAFRTKLATDSGVFAGYFEDR